MKKLLLFTLAMGLGSISFAQLGLISVDEIIEPGSSVITQDSIDGSYGIKAQITNNETNFTYEAGKIAFEFFVSVDGVEINNPAIAGVADTKFLVILTQDLVPGDSMEVNLLPLSNWAPEATAPGIHDFCIELRTISVIGSSTLSNTDNNKMNCKDLDMAWPTSISEVEASEIASIITNENQLTVSVKNAENLSKINVMSITGQVVKTASVRNGVNEIQETFDISNLTAGVYIVTLQSENGSTQAQKIFVQ